MSVRPPPTPVKVHCQVVVVVTAVVAVDVEQHMSQILLKNAADRQSLRMYQWPQLLNYHQLAFLTSLQMRTRTMQKWAYTLNNSAQHIRLKNLNYLMPDNVNWD